MRSLKLGLVLLFVVMALLVVLQNTEVVVVRFLIWQASVSQVVLTMVTLGLGFLLGVLGTLLMRRSPRGGPAR